MKIKKKIKNFIFKGFFATLVGFICGFFGGGGGLVCVPTLEKVYNLETKTAHATAILVMLPLSIISSVIYLAVNTFKLWVTVAVCGGVLIGGIMGAIFLKKLKGEAVRWIFVSILFFAGIRMLVG